MHLLGGKVVVKLIALVDPLQQLGVQHLDLLVLVLAELLELLLQLLRRLLVHTCCTRGSGTSREVNKANASSAKQ